MNRDISRELEAILLLNAGLHIHRINNLDSVEKLDEVEFKVFSQWGEDGIIQYLIHNIPIENKLFVEFGVEDYQEANTRFLLINNNWKGIIFDGAPKNIKAIINSDIYWKYDLKAELHFITKENVNSIIKNNNIPEDIGLLSIDIDGNDYWVWEAINSIYPRIVICEYNGVFGNDKAVTIPYNPDFIRSKAHYSHLYFGASLKALCFLAEQKGYDFVGSNSVGSNSFFVRKDLSKNLPIKTAVDGYIESNIRESRDKNNILTYETGKNRLELIKHLPVIDVLTEKEILLSHLL